MVMIANLQYGWTLFVQPMNATNGWSVADIQIAFSLFVALETWLTPLEGWLVDWIGPKNGPRLMVAFGGVFVALGWMVNSAAGSLGMLYLGAVPVAASAAARSTRPASAMRSSGSPIAAGLRSGSLRPGLARARRSPWCRSAW